jgi:RNA polymerase sigma factor (TIGR02999 family)
VGALPPGLPRGRDPEYAVSMTPRLTDPHLITQVLQAVARNEPLAAEELLPLVYDELRRLARARLDRVGPGQTLQATALVHEAWLRVVGEEDPGWDCRAHFFGAAAKAMRNILVEESRRKATLKRGGERERANGDDLFERLGHEAPVQQMLILDEALDRLEDFDPLKAKIVELRFFTGLTMREVAEVLNLPLTRVEHEWRFARSWLQNEVESFDAAAGQVADERGEAG